jgi:hypothetical protein
MDELAALSQLITRAGGEVFADALGLGLARAARKVAVLHEVAQPGINRVDLEAQAVVGGQAFGDLGGRQVGKQAGGPVGEDPHHCDVLHRLLVQRISQGLQPEPVYGCRGHVRRLSAPTDKFRRAPSGHRPGDPLRVSVTPAQCR